LIAQLYIKKKKKSIAFARR